MTYVVIPTYNEAGNIERLINEIAALNLGISILVVDDNSPDGTGEIVDCLSQSFPKVEVLHNPGKLGLGKAYLEGFKYVWRKKAEIIVTMDADFSHHPRYIPQLLEKVQDFDMVVGSRYTPRGEVHYPWVRKTISFSAVAFARWLMGLKVCDCTSAFRCFNKKVLQLILENDIFSEGYIFLVEMLYLLQKSGCRITEIPIVFEERREGKSKMSAPREVIKGIVALFRLRMKGEVN